MATVFLRPSQARLLLIGLTELNERDLDACEGAQRLEKKLKQETGQKQAAVFELNEKEAVLLYKSLAPRVGKCHLCRHPDYQETAKVLEGVFPTERYFRNLF